MEKDKLLWKGDKNGLFIVKATDVHLAGGNTKTIPMKMLWNSYAPAKTSFFAWKVWQGKVLTIEKLKKRGFN